MMASHKPRRQEGGAVHALLRSATRILLASENDAQIAETVSDAVLLIRASSAELLPLWDQPRPAVVLVKLLAASQRRAETVQATAGRRAYARLANEVVSNFALRLSQAGSSPAEAMLSLLPTARAILRTGTLRGYARLFSLGADGLRELLAPVPARELVEGAAGAEEAAASPTADGPMIIHDYRITGQLENVLAAVKGLMSYAVQLSKESGGYGSGLMQDVHAALADSKLLEHVAKMLFAFPETAPCNETLLECILLMAKGNSDCCPQLRDLGLPGPCTLHLLTAQVVECLWAAPGGGSGPARNHFGLPGDAVGTARQLLCFSSPAVLVNGMLDLRVAQMAVLRPWTLAMTAGAGLPLRRFIGAAAIVTLSSGVFKVSMAAAEAGAQRVRHSRSSQRQQPAGTGGGGGGAGGDTVLERNTAVWLSTALGALLVMSDASLQQKAEHARLAPAGPETEGVAQAPRPAETGGAAEAVEVAAAPPAGPAFSRPSGWWSDALRALDSVLTADLGSHFAVWMDVALLLRCQLSCWGPLPGLLPAAPPPDLASALAAGVLPALERLLRRKHVALLGVAAWRLALCSVLGWRQLSWLLAYGEPREAAALVATLGKAIYHSAATTHGICLLENPSVRARAASLQPLAAEALRSAVRLLLEGLDWARDDTLSRTAAAGSGGGVGTNGSGARQPSDGAAPFQGAVDGSGGGAGGGGDRGAQLLRLLAYAFARWLPVLTWWVPSMHLQGFKGAVAVAERSAAVRDVLRLLSAALDWADDDDARRLAAGEQELPPQQPRQQRAGPSPAAGHHRHTLQRSGSGQRPSRGSPGDSGSLLRSSDPRVGSCAAWRQLLFEDADVLLSLDNVASGVVHGQLEPREVALLPSLMRRLLVGHVEYVGDMLRRQKQLKKQQGTRRAGPDGARGSGGGGDGSRDGGGSGWATVAYCVRLFGPGGAMADPLLAALLRSVLEGAEGAAGSGRGPTPPSPLAAPPLGEQSPSVALPAPAPPLPPLLEVRALLRTCEDVSCAIFVGDSEAGLPLRASEASGGRCVCRECEGRRRRGHWAK